MISIRSPSEPPAACGRCGDLERRVAEERQRVAGVEARGDPGSRWTGGGGKKPLGGGEKPLWF